MTMEDSENVANEADAQAPADQAGSSEQPDEATTLRSRISGYTAKVNELTAAQKALAKERDDLKVALDRALAGEVDKDEALRTVAAEKEAEIQRLRREAALAKIEAKYPETFAVLGEAAANLSPESLAEAEARFRGVASGNVTPPKPIGNNPPRTQGGASTAQTDPAGETLEQMKKRVFGLIPVASGD